MSDLSQATAVRNPFPGLRPFRSEEEHLFFGRENQVDRMIDKLAAHHFLAVVGTSGSGKSSLVNCGLRPALHRGYMARAGASWRMAQFRPGSDPIGALACALAQSGVLFDAWTTDALPAHELVEATLRLGGLGLVDIVQQARLDPGMQLLVVVDQFEELFRFRALARDASKNAYGPAEDAVAFVKLLLEARAQSEVPIHVVLTMRSDFLGECSQFQGLPEAINEGQYLVPRPTREEIRAAITGPVGVAEAAITPVLVTRLLNDVGANPDQLSILQHALNRTWAHWANGGNEKDPLDLPHYEYIGGMEDALNRHAEKAFGELGSDEHKRIGERVFKALTDKGTDARGIRRPTRLSTLCAICGATQAELEAVLGVFQKASRSFLMPPETEQLTSDSVIDISHESLMRVWKRLARWAEEEAESARTYRRLSETATLRKADKASLLRDPDLRMALQWRTKNQPNAAWGAQYQPGFDSAKAFLEQSREVQDAEKLDAEIERRWLAGRWNDAMAFLDRSRDEQDREKTDAEIERRWLASWWRYLPVAVMAIVFVFGQIKFEEMLTPWFSDNLSQGATELGKLKTDLRNVRSAGENKSAAEPGKPVTVAGESDTEPEEPATVLAKVLAHLVVGLPAVLGYMLLAPYTKKRFRERTRADLQRQDSAGADPGAARESEAAPIASAIEVHATGYATFARRTAAHLVDWVVYAFLWFVCGFLLVLFASFLTGIVVDSDIVVIALWVLIPWLYRAATLASRHQATWGMRLAGVFATDVQGRRLSFLRATARHFAGFLSYYLVLFGFLMQPFNEKRQTLHDRLSGTVVLRRPSKKLDPLAPRSRVASPDSGLAVKVS